MPEDSFKNDLKWLRPAIRDVGDYLREEDDLLRAVEKEMAHDVKIKADRKAEERLIEAVLSRSPYGVLSEESGFTDSSRSDLRWVIDPVDGSLNYSRGIPLCCISVALCRDDHALLGVIYDFYRDEMFYAVEGTGAYLNGHAIHVSARAKREQALILSSPPEQNSDSEDPFPSGLNAFKHFQKGRMIGSAALATAYVAAGRADIYQERDLKIWDIAAGALITREAGGVAQMTAQEQPHHYHFFAGNGLISKDE